MAIMEIRLAISALILKYEPWSGVSDKPGEWDEEMKPYDSIGLTPRNGKYLYKRNSSALLELEPPIAVLPIVTNQFNFLGTTLYFYILFFCNRPFSFQDAHC